MVSAIYKDFTGWKWSETAYLVFALVIVAVGSYAASWLEFSAALFNVLCVLLVAKGRISNYYWGLAGVVLYAIVSYKAQLYANMALNIIYIPMQFWGFYAWYKASQGVAQPDVPVRKLNGAQWLIMLAVLVLGTQAMAWGLRSYTDDPSPILDGFCMVASLVAMYLMIKQYSEQWVLWNVINAVTIYLWVIPALSQPGSWAMVAQWSVFQINSLYGAYKWYWVKDNK